MFLHFRNRDFRFNFRGLALAANSKADVSLAEKEITVPELADVFGITPRRVDQLTVEGAFKKSGRGRYVLGHAAQAYVEYLKEEGRKAKASTTDEELRGERARKLRLENDQTEAMLLPADAVFNVLDEVVASVRVGFSGLPARVTRDIPLREIIETEVNSVLAAVSDLLENRAALLAGGKDAEAAAEDADG